MNNPQAETMKFSPEGLGCRHRWEDSLKEESRTELGAKSFTLEHGISCSVDPLMEWEILKESAQEPTHSE